ncbi:MMPL family transporter [Streptomyces sp. NPDC096311]|uniref:MMPL family transporter n=1 Tax=Streptomyces sp. NPDC096311 TaxID=3366083 RepID=UPI00382C77D1
MAAVNRAVRRPWTKSGPVVVWTPELAMATRMASIFVAVLLDPDPTLKAIGFSFTVGVLVDALVVRLTLVPAVMALVGARIWYHPRWYGRLVPDPDVEGDRLEEHLDHTDGDRQPAIATN